MTSTFRSLAGRSLALAFSLAAVSCSVGPNWAAAPSAMPVEAALESWEHAHDALIAARADGVDPTCATFDREEVESSLRQKAAMLLAMPTQSSIEMPRSYNGARRIEPEFASKRAEIEELIRAGTGLAPDLPDAEAAEVVRAKTQQLLAKVEELESVERFGYVDSSELGMPLAEGDVPSNWTRPELIEDLFQVSLSEYEGAPGAAARFAGLRIELEEATRQLDAVVDRALASGGAQVERSPASIQRLNASRERLRLAREAATGEREALESVISGAAAFVRFFDADAAGTRRLQEVRAEELKSFQELRASTGRMVSVEVLDKEPRRQTSVVEYQEQPAGDFSWSEVFRSKNLRAGGSGAKAPQPDQSELDARELKEATKRWDTVQARVLELLTDDDVPIYTVEVADARTAELDAVIVSVWGNVDYLRLRLDQLADPRAELQSEFDRLLSVLDELRLAEQQHAAALAMRD